MAIFADMLHRLRQFLNRPLAEDFSVRNQAWLSAQAGLYIFLFLYLLGTGRGSGYPPLTLNLMFALGCVISSFLANTAIPKLTPTFYDEDRWTVGKHALHVLLVLLCVTIGNQLVLYALSLRGPSFFSMYLTVTLVGFFPITMGVLVAERRRLTRNLAHAQTINDQLAQRPEHPLTPPQPYTNNEPVAEKLKPVLLVSGSGKERLTLQPDHLLCIESVGNYVEVHWVNSGQPQKTVLRATLKDVADALAVYPQFLRCHRAFVVNLNAVSQTEGNARGYLLTVTGLVAKVPVSRSYLDAFDARLTSLS